MAKQTLLEIVQDILSDLSGDVVNSFDDTVESEQVANIVRSTYNAMQANRNWKGAQRIVQLVPSTDNLLPTHMKLNEPIKELISVYYDKRKAGDTQLRSEQVFWKDPDAFLRYINSRNSNNADTMIVTDPSGAKLLILNNKAPEYFTSFDDDTLVFDSFDAAVDSTLQSSKTIARAYTIPTFIMSNDYVPDITEEAFPALIEESRTKAFTRLRQIQDPTSAVEAQRQQNWLSRKNWRANGGIKYPNYGRSRGRYRDPTFKQGR